MRKENFGDVLFLSIIAARDPKQKDERHIPCIAIEIINMNKNVRYFYEPYIKISKNGKLEIIRLIDKLDNIEFPVRLEYGQPVTALYGFTDTSFQSYSPETELYAEVYTTLGEDFQSNPLKISEIRKVQNP